MELPIKLILRVLSTTLEVTCDKEYKAFRLSFSISEQVLARARILPYCLQLRIAYRHSLSLKPYISGYSIVRVVNMASIVDTYLKHAPTRSNANPSVIS